MAPFIGAVPPILGLAGQHLVGVVFLIASAGKLLSKSDSKQSVESYGLIRGKAARWVGASIPFMEVCIAVCLLTGFLRLPAGVFAATLLCVFSFAQAIVLLRGREVACGCFGTLSSEPVGWRNVAINVSLIAVCFLFIASREGFSTRNWLNYSFYNPSPLASPSELLLLQMIIASGMLHALVFKQLVFNRRLQLTYHRHLEELAAASAVQKLAPVADRRLQEQVT